MNKNVENISIEGARLVFRNFSGKADKFNPKGGNRQFSVIIDDLEFASELEREGWNVKHFRPREEDEGDPGAFLPVKVSFGVIPPHIYLCTKKSKSLLTEESIDSLDYAEISDVDIVIRPYCYDVNGKQGISAYVKTMYVNVIEDEFASKYEYEEEDVPF